MTQLEILPPASAASGIATAADAVKRLAKMFPKHSGELLEWLPSYQRALGHLAPQRLSEAFEATMAAWSRSSPPKPADFAAHAPRSTVAIGDTAQDGLTWFDPAEKARKCTRAGYERAREIARRLVDDALRCAPEPLSPDEACRAAMHLRAEAWVAAQHEVITGRGEVLEITRADIARLRGEVAA